MTGVQTCALPISLRECTSKAPSEQNAHVQGFDQTVMYSACAGMLQSNLPVSYLQYTIDMAIDEYKLTLASKNLMSLHFVMFGKQPAILGKLFAFKAWVYISTAIRDKGHLHS